MDILSAYDPRQGLPSASAFGRLALCPGSFTMEKACPDESSDAASEGTLLHAYMEQLLTGEPWEGTPLTAEQVELCERAMRLLDGVKEMIERDNPGAVFHLVSTEERVFYRNLFGTAYYSGQWDALFEVNCPDSSFMMVADWKFGRVEVDSAEANRQLEALVPLVAQKEHNDNAIHQGIYAAIIQPRVAGPASVAFYDAEAIDQAEQRSLAVAKAAMDPDAPRYCSEEACRYCRAKAVCHEAAAMVQQAALIATDRDKWELFSPDEKIQAYRLAKTAKKWAAAAEYRFEQDVAAGLIPGFEMGPGRTSFTVTDPSGAFSALNAEFPEVVTAEAFAGCCKVGITELDKLVHEACKAANPKATTKSSREWLRQLLAEYGESKTTKGSVKEIGQ
ncbi:DUF2800 domain-containing protein [Akkermansia muciniphila]|uniref:DUF2800 domain-containing protein n=1 Tax=Akkermansia muciniphila TaxID=239935 RepID=UPI0033AD0812